MSQEASAAGRLTETDGLCRATNSDAPHDGRTETHAHADRLLPPPLVGAGVAAASAFAAACPRRN